MVQGCGHVYVLTRKSGQFCRLLFRRFQFLYYTNFILKIFFGFQHKTMEFWMSKLNVIKPNRRRTKITDFLGQLDKNLVSSSTTGSASGMKNGILREKRVAPPTRFLIKVSLTTWEFVGFWKIYVSYICKLRSYCW